MHTVFVYGTLRRDQSNHRLLREAQYLGEARLRERGEEQPHMFSLGGFPAVVFQEPHPIQPPEPIVGELYSVTIDQFRALDRLEGYPNFYGRTVVRPINEQGEVVSAWMYFLPAGYRNLGAYLPGSDWVAFRNRQDQMLNTTAEVTF